MMRIILSLCLGGTLAAIGQTGVARPPSQISGHVYRSGTGDLVSLADVSLSPRDQETSKAAGPPRVTRTGPDGAFTFSNLPAGAYMVAASRNGFTSDGCRGAAATIGESADCKVIALISGQVVDDLDLRLTPAGVIAGLVHDEDREPVAGVDVYALRISYLRGGRRQMHAPARAVSDDQGRFRMEGLEPGMYYVRAGGLIRHPRPDKGLKEGPGGGLRYRDTYYPGTGRLDEARPVEIGSAEGPANIRIPLATERTYTVSGVIVDAGRSGVLKPSHVEVVKRGDGEQMWSGGGVAIEPNGSFTIRRLSPGEYTLAATAVNRNSGRVTRESYGSVHIVNSDVRTAIELGRAGEVRGRLGGPRALSLGAARIVLESSGMSTYSADLDSTGGFDIRNLPPGEYTFSLWANGVRQSSYYLRRVSCSGRDYASEPLRLDNGAVLNCDLTAGDDTGVVSGRVSDGANPVADLVVVLIPESPVLRRQAHRTLTATTDTAGRYTLAGAIPGDYLLFAVAPSDDHVYFASDFADRNRSAAKRVTVAPNGALVVELQPLRPPR